MTCTDTCCRPEQESNVAHQSWRSVKARKDHTCADCGGPIPAGTTYVRTFAVVDGQGASSKTHTPYGFCVSWEA